MKVKENYKKLLKEIIEKEFICCQDESAVDYIYRSGKLESPPLLGGRRFFSKNDIEKLSAYIKRKDDIKRAIADKYGKVSDAKIY